MINLQTFYVCQCDSCKIYYQDNEGVAEWIMKGDTKDKAINNGGWHQVGEFTYCPICYKTIMVDEYIKTK